MGATSTMLLVVPAVRLQLWKEAASLTRPCYD